MRSWGVVQLVHVTWASVETIGSKCLRTLGSPWLNGIHYKNTCNIQIIKIVAGKAVSDIDKQQQTLRAVKIPSKY